MSSAKTKLIIERSGNDLWGRISVKGNLIVENAKNVESLKKTLKQLALDFENVEISDFEVFYDLTSFFESYPFLNISEIAAKAGISPSLMRQYVSGNKFPSQERVKEIENAIHEIGKELTKIKLHKPAKELA